MTRTESKEEDRESIQSSTTADPRQHVRKNKNTRKQPRGQPFP